MKFCVVGAIRKQGETADVGESKACRCKKADSHDLYDRGMFPENHEDEGSSSLKNEGSTEDGKFSEPFQENREKRHESQTHENLNSGDGSQDADVSNNAAEIVHADPGIDGDGEIDGAEHKPGQNDGPVFADISEALKKTPGRRPFLSIRFAAVIFSRGSHGAHGGHG